MRRRVLAPEVDRELVDMLGTVVHGRRHRRQAQIPGYTVAGKTGTAQKPGQRRLLESNTTRRSSASSRPRTRRSRSWWWSTRRATSHFGGDVAAPAFEQIGSWCANTRGIKPDRPCRPQRSLGFALRMQLGDADRGRPAARRLGDGEPDITAVTYRADAAVARRAARVRARAHSRRARLRRRGRRPRRRGADRRARPATSTVPQLVVESSRHGDGGRRRRLLRPPGGRARTWSASRARTARPRPPS